MVYVISKNGQPLMPTDRYGKVRHLIKDGKAKIITRCPFTIKLLYDSTEYVQSITLGVDAGSKTIGLSASTDKEEVYASEVALRTDVVDLLSARREFRRARRNRTKRYRPARFNNRVHSKNKGWLAPSIECKINTHLKVIKNLHKFLPISNIIVEVASFDIQKIKNPDIEGSAYQEGPQMHFWNVREYVLYRDGHKCQHCHGKSKDKRLNVHHLESRKTGGDSPNNLITLCETCHNNYHDGKFELTIKRGISFKDAAFMGIMRWAFYSKLKVLYPNVRMTYGYITKNTRIAHKLPKEHCIDALCISGHPTAKLLDSLYLQKAVRSHNRQIHKATINKGGVRKLNQSPKYVFGYQLFDEVLCKGQHAFVFGRRASGSFDIRKLNGEKLSAGINYKKLLPLAKRKNLLVERAERSVASSP